MRDISCCQPGKSCLSSFFFWGGAIPVVDLCSLVIRKILGFRFGLFLMFLSLQLYIYTCHWPVPRRFGTNGPSPAIKSTPKKDPTRGSPMKNTAN